MRSCSVTLSFSSWLMFVFPTPNFESTTKNSPARYWLRAVKPDEAAPTSYEPQTVRVRFRYESPAQPPAS